MKEMYEMLYRLGMLGLEDSIESESAYLTEDVRQSNARKLYSFLKDEYLSGQYGALMLDTGYSKRASSVSAFYKALYADDTVKAYASLCQFIYEIPQGREDAVFPPELIGLLIQMTKDYIECAK